MTKETVYENPKIILVKAFLLKQDTWTKKK